MTEGKQTTQAQTTVKGSLSFDDKVIQKIIGLSLEQIDGLLTVDGGFFSNLADKVINNDDVTTGITAEVGTKQVAADMDIVVEYGKDAHKLYEEMKQLIAKQIHDMTGLELVELNVKVVDIKTKEQHEADSVTLQDRAANTVQAASKTTSKGMAKAKNAAGDAVEEAKARVE